MLKPCLDKETRTETTHLGEARVPCLYNVEENTPDAPFSHGTSCTKLTIQ